MTVSASGRVLTPLLVSRGAPNGRIERNEFATYAGDIEYACQGNAWMDKRVMHLWIGRILKPYIDQAPPGIVPLLLLDTYRCHMMKSTVKAIENLGVEVEHIPGGCTSLCQSVDVGVNKPFKSMMRKLWEGWMISTGLHKGKITPPTRKYIAQWYSNASQDLPPQMVRNLWRHGMYSYYPPVQEDEHAAGADEDVNNNANQNDNPVQQEDSSDDEYNDDSGDDDDELRNHSEPLFSYREVNQPHNQQHQEEEHATGDVSDAADRNDNPVQQQANSDDEISRNKEEDTDDSGGDDDNDDELRNHSEPLLSYHEDNQQQEEEHAAGDVNNAADRNDNPVQQQGDEYNESGDDDEIRNHSEPLFSYHDENNQQHKQHNHRQVGKTYGNSCSTLESLPPLPDTMELVQILQQIQKQHASRSEQHDEQQDHLEPLLS